MEDPSFDLRKKARDKWFCMPCKDKVSLNKKLPSLRQLNMQGLVQTANVPLMQPVIAAPLHPQPAIYKSDLHLRPPLAQCPPTPSQVIVIRSRDDSGSRRPAGPASGFDAPHLSLPQQKSVDNKIRIPWPRSLGGLAQ